MHTILVLDILNVVSLAGSADPSLLLYKLHPTGLIQTSSLANDKAPYSKKLPGVAHSNFFLIWHPSDPDRLVSLDEEGIRRESCDVAQSCTAVAIQTSRIPFVCCKHKNFDTFSLTAYTVL